MRLVGATIVRDAADVIEAFVRHNLSVLDELAIGNETAAFDHERLMNRLVRRILKTSDADWVFPLDSDEFIKVGARSRLEAVLAEVPAAGHLVLPWLTPVAERLIAERAMDSAAGMQRASRVPTPRSA